MAGKASKWTTMGSNFDAVDDGDGKFDGYVNPSDNGVGETSGASSFNTRYMMDVHPRHECHVWLEDNATVYTEPFDFPVRGDLTIVFNATDLNLSATPGGCTAKLQGSIDGTNYVDLKSLGITTFDDKVVQYVYDYDNDGRAPLMRLSMTQANDVDNTSQPIKIVVTEQ